MLRSRYEYSGKLNTVIDKVAFGRISPLKQKILLELASGPLTLQQLSEKTGSSIYTIGKQLSLLQLRTNTDSMQKKGILKPLVKKNKDAGVKTTYFLAGDVRYRIK